MIRRAVALIVTLGLSCLLIPLVGEAPRSAAAQIIGGPAHATFNPTDGKVFILVIGNDARKGNPDTTRADAMHIVGINAKTMRAGVLNFPRDSYVPVPGHGSMKMTEALYVGGPELLVKTIENETGIRLDYWIMTGFVGFVEIVKDLGGVRLDVPYPMHDSGSGAKLKAGPQVLEPGEALAFNRTRKTLPGGDIDRTTNQGLFLLALLEQFQADAGRGPAAVLQWMAIGRKWTRMDIPPEDLFRLGVLAAQIPRANVKSVTVPVSIGSVGISSVVFIQPGAKAVYRRFEQTGAL
jgi:polyisoprenyl-teichoic acid--peptidoglycan teichoic acid transferase